MENTLRRKKIQGTVATYIYENGTVVNEKTNFTTIGNVTGNVPYRKTTITYKDGSQRTVENHRLVAEAFMKANWKVNSGKVVTFIDGNPENISIDNLELTTRVKNADHNITSLGKRYGRLTNDEVVTIRERYSNYSNPKVGVNNLSKKFNVSKTVIVNVVNRFTYRNV